MDKCLYRFSGWSYPRFHEEEVSQLVDLQTNTELEFLENWSDSTGVFYFLTYAYILISHSYTKFKYQDFEKYDRTGCRYAHIRIDSIEI